MSKRPDESKLIDFLYGDLDGAERESIAAYLHEHPEEKARLEGMNFARKALGRMEEKEVIPPPFIFGEEPTRERWWDSASFRWPLGMAASFLVMVLLAKVLGVSVSMGGNELRIAFNGGSGKKDITEDRVNHMIDESLRKNNETLQAYWKHDKEAMEKSIHENLEASSDKLRNLMKQASQANEVQVRDFASRLQKENSLMMKEYLQLSSADQRTYLEGLLVDFSKYLQEQRREDLQMLQTRLASVERNTGAYRAETEQLLTSLISGTSNVRRNE